MSTKKLLILTGTFLALLAFVVLYERHLPSSEEAAKARKRLIDLRVEDVTGVVLERSDLPKVELQKAPSGKWTLAGERPGPADAVTADGLVSDLSRLDLFGDVQSSFDPKEYGLDAPKAKVTLSFKDGSRRTVSFGRPIAGTDATAAAEGGRMGAVKFPPTATLAKPYDEFRSRALFDVPTTEITQVTIARGPNKTVLVREAGTERSPASPWRIEAPVKDLAASSFVDQLLGDLAAARVSDFPVLGQADLSRVGLSPPGTAVVLQKGPEVVANLAFGAAKADAAGKMYARRDAVPLVIDDRVQESLGKELAAFREPKVLGIDSWNVSRVSLETEGQRTGAEKVEGEWRTAGTTVGGRLVDDLVDRVVRTEVRRFIPLKEYSAVGLAVPKGKKAPAPLGRVQLTLEGKTPPVDVAIYSSPALAAEKLVLVEATGRADGMLVEGAAWDELKAFAAKLKAAGSPPPGKGAVPPPASTPSPASTPGTPPAAASTPKAAAPAR